MRTRTMKTIALVGLLALLATACGGSSDTGTSAEPRTVTISALDTLRFDPDEVTVAVGETVRFVVTNDGEIEHEFVVGDRMVQDEHESAMSMGMGDEDAHGEGMDPLASIELAPGETAEATITFDVAGELLYACHVPGHYQGGMVGTLTVT